MSMSTTSAASIVQEFENRFVAGDLDGVLELLTDDITVHECQSVPYPGDHVGKPAFVQLAAAFGDSWDLKDISFRFIDAGPDQCVVLVTMDCIAKVTNQPLIIKIAEAYRMRDGRIADIEVYYFDTHAMHIATGGHTAL